MDGGRLHIVMFPWLAFGHMIPFLELSKALAKKGHLVSFISTPRNIQRLPSDLSPLINLVNLPLPHVDGLPEQAEATTDLPGDKSKYLKEALDGLEGPLAKFLEEASPTPDWVVYDFAQYWTPRAAARAGVPCAHFSVYSVWMHAFFGPPSATTDCVGAWTKPEQLMAQPNWIPFPSKTFRFHEALKFVGGHPRRHNTPGGISNMQRFALAVQGCRVFALRCSAELESDWLALVQELYMKPVVPVGLLPPSVQERTSDTNVSSNSNSNTNSIFEWLDEQQPGSVVYVALGSEAILSSELLHELALGLEKSRLPFLWALRKGPGSAGDMEMMLLPDRFKDRTEGQGLVALGWVPQIKILAHPSVGGFLTHSGWSSVIEGLQFGLPLILLPIFVDQGLIAQVMAERRVGVEIPRKEEDGFFTRDGVAESLRFVMVDEEGEVIRSNARQATRIFCDRDRHDQYVDAFVQILRENGGQPVPPRGEV